MKNIKTVFFDLYQTLINVDVANDRTNTDLAFKSVLVKYLLDNGVAEAHASQLFVKYSELVNKFYDEKDKKTFQHNFAKLLQKLFAEEYKIILDENQLSELMYEYRKIARGFLKMYARVPEMLETLSKKYKLIVASHTQGLFTDLELQELGIRKYFTNCVYSSDIGFKKTADDFFKECINISECKPEECVMVGDNMQEDIVMAQRNGINTIWIINPATKDKFKAEVVPDQQIEIEKIIDLPKVIDTLCNQ